MYNNNNTLANRLNKKAQELEGKKKVSDEVVEEGLTVE